MRSDREDNNLRDARCVVCTLSEQTDIADHVSQARRRGEFPRGDIEVTAGYPLPQLRELRSSAELVFNHPPGAFLRKAQGRLRLKELHPFPDSSQLGQHHAPST